MSPRSRGSATREDRGMKRAMTRSKGHSPARWLTAAVIIVLLFLASFFFIGALSTSDDGWRNLASIEEIEEEEVMYFPEHELFLVHREGGGSPVALSAIDPHLGHRDAYCRSSGQFQGIHGEKYDRLGFYFGGPAPRGLDRYAVRIVENRVEVEVTEVIQGRPRSAGPKLEPEGDFCIDTGTQAPEGFL